MIQRLSIRSRSINHLKSRSAYFNNSQAFNHHQKPSRKLFSTTATTTTTTMSNTTIHAAQVTTFGEPPKYVTLPSPPPPSVEEIQVRLLAAGLPRVARSRASGIHYSIKTLPHIPGVDGVGLTIPDNKLVYVETFNPATGGSYREVFNVPKRDVKPLPADADAVQVAALTNPVMSSWMALTKRTVNLPKGFTALIIGVTSASGKIAIDVARRLGAGKIIGCARNEGALKAMTSLDGYVVLKDKVEETDFAGLGDVDVVLDYVYGAMAEHLFKTLSSKTPVQYVHIGALSGGEISLSAAILRSKDITIRGSGPGAFDTREMGKEMPNILDAVCKMAVKKDSFKVVKLADIETVWNEKGAERVVFVP